MADQKPALELTLNPERAIITIDGRRFGIRHVHEITLNQLQDLQTVLPRIGELLQVRRRNRSQASELNELLDATLETVFIAPAAIRKALGELHRVQIVQVFTARFPISLARRTSAASSQTGSSSFRGSRGSTPAPVRSTGSIASRSVSSRRAHA